MKKAIYILIIIVLLFSGCSGNNSPTPSQSTATSDITWPNIQYGIVADTVQNRFAQTESALYFATEDGIYEHNFTTKATSFFLLADAPSYLAIVDGKLAFREVSMRDSEFNPTEFALSLVDLQSGEKSSLDQGNINWLQSYDNRLYYVLDNQYLYSLDIKTQEKNRLLNDFIASCSLLDGKIYLSLNDNLCQYSITGNTLSTLAQNSFPVNIYPTAKGVYFSTEGQEGLQFYNADDGSITPYNNAPEWGVVYENRFYAVQNDNGFRLLQYENTNFQPVCELGALQSASVPYFKDHQIYFYISSDTYYGLISYNTQSETIAYLSNSGG